MTTRNKGKQIEPNTTHQEKKGFHHWKKLILGVVAVGAVGALIWLPGVNLADASEITVYKSASCGCCNKWVDHLRDEGFKVITKNRQDMNQVKQTYGVDYELRSCHTAVVEEYVLEGHVPASDVRRLLKEKPDVQGLAVPGMPAGSPGMEGKYNDPYDVIAFSTGGRDTIYEKH